MNDLKFYEISEKYIKYLSSYEPFVYKNKKANQDNSRKYIGIVFTVGNFKYFVPLSSFKTKHLSMDDRLDFIKIKNYAVINLNNMIPVPDGCFTYVEFSNEADKKYASLLLSEYRYIKLIQKRILKNAETVYNLKVNGIVSPLTNRCNDFRLLESLCLKYVE